MNKFFTRINVFGHRLMRNDSHPIYSGTRNCAFLKFNFDEDWGGNAAAIISQGIYVEHVLLDGNFECPIPNGFMEVPGVFALSVYAGDRRTINTVEIEVLKSGYTEGNPIPPDPEMLYVQSENISHIRSVEGAFEFYDGEWNEVTGGGSGASDKLWRPTVDVEGNISWYLSMATTPPTTQNIKGTDGKNGIDGKDGINGVDGNDGKSAFESAMEGGYAGSINDFHRDLEALGGLAGAILSITGGGNIPSVDPALNNNSWEKIGLVSRNFIAANNLSAADVEQELGWAIGDVKELVLDGVIYDMQLVSINHYDRSDGKGKAGMVFQSVKTKPSIRFNADVNVIGGWRDSHMRNNAPAPIFYPMPGDLHAAILPVDIFSAENAPAGSNVVNTSDKIFVPSRIEIIGDVGTSFPGEGSQYTYWALHNKNTDRIKYNAVTNAVDWWTLRSLQVDNLTNIIAVNNLGNTAATSVNGTRGISFVFCV